MEEREREHIDDEGRDVTDDLSEAPDSRGPSSPSEQNAPPSEQNAPPADDFADVDDDDWARERPERKFEGWRLIPRVRDIGFFQGLLESRARLATAAVASTTAALAVIWVVSSWMRTTSGSSMVNVLIIAAMLTGLIVASYIDALLVGDLFFPGRWRERVLEGDDFEPEDWQEEQAAVKEYNAPFFLVLIGLLLGLAWFSQVLTNGFLLYYQNVGFAVTLMRSDDPDDRYMGLESIANPLYEEHWKNEELHAQIAKLVDDPDPRVQQMALYTAGRLGVAEGADDMIEAFRNASDPEVRASAAMALGRMKWDRALAYLTTSLNADDATETVQLGIVRGLAMMEDERGGQAVTRLLEQCSPDSPLSDELIFNAFYALRRMGYEKGSKVALAYLRGELCGAADDTQLQCAAVDALRFIATDDDLLPLQRAYSDIPVDATCEYEMWRYREEKAIEIVEKEPMRAKMVRAVGNRKDFDTYEWIWNVGADESELKKTRKVAEIYAREMLELYKREHGQK